jgi:dTDP-4-amino-4,6-dideoxygalactose transaminase
MPDWLVPLSDVRFGEDEVEAVAATYRSGWLSQGPNVAAFESAFADLLGIREAVAVSSGTAALQLICTGLGLGPGDEVVLPSLTFAASAAAVVHAGALPVFAEIVSERRPWLSPAAAEAALTERTRAILTVGYGGHPGELAALRRLADVRGLALIEDAAHALGARAGERPAGTVGDAGAFSFFANKNLTLGEGGMVVTRDPALASRIRLLRSHGLSSDTWARHQGGDAGYDVIEPGFNFRLDEPRAALGQRLLARLAADNQRRAARADRYARKLAGLDGVRCAIEPEPGVRSAWHLFVLLLDPGVDRAAFRARMRERGVQTSIHYPPLHLTRAFRPASATNLPRTEDYAARTVTIPLFPHMTDEQQTLVIESVEDALRGVRSGAEASASGSPS